MAANTRQPHETRAAPSRALVATAVQDLKGDRIIGIVGGLTVLVATGLSWYSAWMSSAAGSSWVGLSLWHTRDLAAWLVLAVAVIGVLSFALTPAEERAGGVVAAVAGFAVMLYSVVTMFVTPAGGASVDVGPFVAPIGGFLLLVGGLAASDDARTITSGRAGA
ncbi:MAG TPA: hypothetical protein VMT10_05985 [Solirubrobacteraceae bacterium]|nr:hypothetical protein [Solirubrobacteraceae bacterium]